MVAKAAPDGYTVGLFDTAFVTNPTFYAKLPFDALRDFRAVMVVATGPSVLVVHPSLGVSTVKELIALAKAKPGALTFASGGSGTAIHLSGEMLKIAAGINLLHVPYKGAGPAITDVVAGQVHMMFAQPGTVLGQVNTKRMRAIAMNGEQRWSGMPNVPTFAEAGVAGMEASMVWQVMAPAATPAAVITVLHSALQLAIAAPEIRDRLAELGYVVVAADPDKSAAIIRGYIEQWGRAVKASGARAD
jgi:tripartite-type tricarboxylate transporter receptor subunit TctC